jgi:chromosome partitioning protein
MVNRSVKRAAFYVEKGGVGKTTSAAHTAVSASQDHGLDVLLIDLAGTQNDLATQFGLTDEVKDVDAPISAVFGDDWEFIRENIPDIVDRMVFETDEGPDLIPSDPGLGGADNNLANVPREERYGKLEAFISEELSGRYDLVLMDLPGKEDNIALNGLFAAENTVAPLKPGAFERAQLAALDEDLQEISESHDVEPQLTLVFASMVDRRTNLAEEFVDELKDAYPDVSGEAIPATQNIGNQQAAGRTLFDLKDDELYATGREAREAYRANTELLLNRIEAR